MIAQYTQAGLVSENKRLAVPASVDSIPSSAMQEDHVSMGWHAARKLRRRSTTSGGSSRSSWSRLRGRSSCALPSTPAPGTASVIAALRATVPGPGPDRFLAPELEAAVDVVRTLRP